MYCTVPAPWLRFTSAWLCSTSAVAALEGAAALGPAQPAGAAAGACGGKRDGGVEGGGGRGGLPPAAG